MSSWRSASILGAACICAVLTWPGTQSACLGVVADDTSKEKDQAAASAEAEKFLRDGKPAEARKSLEPLLKDLPKGPARDHALYLDGFASLFLKDYAAAGRSLNQLAPFAQPVFGPHARYLTARIHHAQDERAEAVDRYEAVLADYQARIAHATEALKQPDAFKDNETEKTRLETFIKAPLPDYVSRAGFYLGVLYYEAGRFNDARSRFEEFAAQDKRSPLHSEATLFKGFSEVQMQQYTGAIATLGPIVEQESTRSILALWWLGKAQANAADPDDEGATAAALKKGLNTLQRAAEKSRPVPDDDSDRSRTAHVLRAEILLDVAETQIRDGQYKEAARTFGDLVGSKRLPKREEELLQRWASALNQAGAFQESNDVCARFQKTYPRSTLLPEVLFRQAENNYFLAPSTNKDAARLYEEAAQIYHKVAEGFPEFPNANMARLGLALVHYRRGDYEKAQAELEKITAQDCNGELAHVPLVLADCLIRLTPAGAEDALAAGRIQEQLGRAAELLSDFVSRQPDDPQAPEALLRLGLCRQRLAALITQDEEHKKMLEAARSTYERILTEYPLNDVRPQAALERARCIALLGDANEAINRLRAFSFDPLAKHPIAPLAMLQWATLLRGQDNKAAEAAKVMALCRRHYEKALLQDPTRASWVPVLQFHHAATLQDSGQLAEARAAFESLRKQYPDRPEATEALVFIGQCLRDEASQKVDQANQTLGMPDLKPAAAEAAKKSLEEGKTMSREAVQYFEQKAGELAKIPSPIRARLLYQAAWSYRALGDQEVDAARNKLREQLQAKLQEDAAKNTPEGEPVPTVPPPEVPRAKIDLQASEKRTRAFYQTILDAFPDLPLANSVRLELAEVHASRGELAAAIKLLKEALDREPPTDLTERLRMRLGVCLAAQGDTKAALMQFEAVFRNAESGFAAQAHYQAGDTLLAKGNVEAAVKHLAVFRDEEKFQNVGGLSDAALLRLGQAYAKKKNGEECRKTMAVLLERFSDSPHAADARYTIGWSLQQEKHYDAALAAYKLIGGEPKAEAASRAQLQSGVCHLLRKKPADALERFLAVKSDNADVTALALLAAAHCYTLLDQAPEAAKVQKQVVQEHPKSAWADIAQKHLDGTDASAPHDAAEAVRLLAPDRKDAWKLDSLGDMKPDTASLDDPTVELSHALTLARTPPLREKPAAWLKLSLPEPFEFRLPIRAEDLPAEEMVSANSR